MIGHFLQMKGVMLLLFELSEILLTNFLLLFQGSLVAAGEGSTAAKEG
jgi:hypothetical protein